MVGNRIRTLNNEDVSEAFQKFETLLSSQKARECLKKAEEELAYDTEVFLQPVREHLAECIELVGSLTRERGTWAEDLQILYPLFSQWLNPGQKFSQETARLEKEIAAKKKEHPDFVLAFKLQILVRKYETSLEESQLDSVEYSSILDKLERAKATLSDHLQTKIRIAQKAFAPDMLELAAAQLELSQHLEKLLLLKQELLDAVRNHTKQTLLNLAKVFEKADQDLADTILMQTQAVKTTGSLPKSSMAKEGPSDLKEYREALGEQKERLDQFDARLQTCRDELNGLIEFEEAIFNTYGEQLRERGVQFKKRAKVAKTVSGLGPKKQPAARMVGRNK